MAQKRRVTKTAQKTAPPDGARPGWLQLAAFAIMLAAAAALWVGRDHVGTVFAAITGADQTGATAGRNARPGVPVVVARAGSRSNDIYVDAIATARAKRFVTLYPEVSGEVIEFDKHAGDTVQAGEVILKLDSKDAELAVELARVRVQEAELALARARQLMERNVNSAAKVQDARTVLERTRIELRQAEEALAKRTLRAPFDGVLGIPKVEKGDRVTSATPIITVDDRSELVVEIEVPEEYLTHVSTGQSVKAQTPSFPGRPFLGTVERIDSRVMPASRTVMVRAALPNPRDLLRPGMSFAVELTIPGEEFATVPELALQWGKGESFVWRVGADNTAKRVVVRSVKRLNRVILVDGAVRKGDLVVVEGVQRLRAGRKVSYSLPDPAPGA